MQKKLKISAADKEALEQVKAILETQVDEFPSIKVLCKKSGLNQDKLKKGFSFLYGMSLRAYHVHLRMNQAKSLLLNSEKSVREVSLEIGYAYTNNFCTQFKKATGKTPLGFRASGNTLAD